MCVCVCVCRDPSAKQQSHGGGQWLEAESRNRRSLTACRGASAAPPSPLFLPRPQPRHPLAAPSATSVPPTEPPPSPLRAPSEPIRSKLDAVSSSSGRPLGPTCCKSTAESFLYGFLFRRARVPYLARAPLSLCAVRSCAFMCVLACVRACVRALPQQPVSVCRRVPRGP
jgi:hypothetical protein